MDKNPRGKNQELESFQPVPKSASEACSRELLVFFNLKGSMLTTRLCRCCPLPGSALRTPLKHPRPSPLRYNGLHSALTENQKRLNFIKRWILLEI